MKKNIYTSKDEINSIVNSNHSSPSNVLGQHNIRIDDKQAINRPTYRETKDCVCLYWNAFIQPP